jgi:hypothetical protein
MVCAPLVGLALAVAIQTAVQDAARVGADRALWAKVFQAPDRTEELAKITKQYGSLDAYMDRWALKVWSWAFLQQLLHRLSLPRELLKWCLWPWLTLAILMLFRVSMRRKRIKAAHVLRCVVYSGTPLLVLGLLGISATVAEGLAPGTCRCPSPAALLGLYRRMTPPRRLGLLTGSGSSGCSSQCIRCRGPIDTTCALSTRRQRCC